MAYDFHYTPTGTGVISGKEVLEQTEDAINDLGNTAISGVQEALDKAEQALTNSENAVDDAQNALNTANNAEGVAIQAQTDVGNLSGTVTNIGNRVTTAESNISNLQGRMTTAESNITNIQGRMTTAESNIGNLQTAVSTAQATANSAQQTATTARQQSYVLRYSSTAITDNSTIAYSTLDNTDNIKVSDKIIDTDGKIFSIVSVDSDNSTVTVGSALIDLALDANVVHTSGDETINGVKTFSDNTVIGSNNVNITVSNRQITANGSYSTPTGNSYSYIQLKAMVNYTDSSPSIDATVGLSVQENAYSDGKNRAFNPSSNNIIDLGLPGKRWANVYATNYYYGSSEVEFSTKFVTTDTAQTISGVKTFSNTPVIYNSDVNGTTQNLYLRNQLVTKGATSTGGSQLIRFSDSADKMLSRIQTNKVSNGNTTLNLRVDTLDTNNNDVTTEIQIISARDGSKSLSPQNDNAIDLGRTLTKWKNIYVNQINSLTPSSLSLPSGNASDVIDISSYITDLSGAVNLYTPPANGYLIFTISSGSQVQIYSTTGAGLPAKWTAGGGVGIIRGFVPVLKNVEMKISVNATTMDSFYFIPCQGNV